MGRAVGQTRNTDWVQSSNGQISLNWMSLPFSYGPLNVLDEYFNSPPKECPINHQAQDINHGNLFVRRFFFSLSF